MTFSLWFTSEPVISVPGVWYAAEIRPITGNCADLPDAIALTMSAPSVADALSNEVNTSPANTLRNRASSEPPALTFCFSMHIIASRTATVRNYPCIGVVSWHGKMHRRGFLAWKNA